jgi:prephenate dehydrogenase
MSRKLAVLGTGLIGGSVALAARALGDRVAGYDRDPATLERAVELGALDEAAASAGAAVAGAEVVVVCLPVDAIAPCCAEIAPALGPDAVVTDVGSAKAAVVAAAEAVLEERFVGGHPMAGSERHGIEAADARLFQDAWWILTPTAATASHAYARVSELVASLGARPVAVDPAVHDELVAHLSHVPQLTASALVDAAVRAGSAAGTEALLGLAGPGFRDVTRIAASHAELWVAILRANREAVLGALDGLRARLRTLAGLIEQDRWDDLRAFLERARQARLGLFAKPDYGGEPVGLALLVPDRPGVLAEVTTAAGELGANIEDLRIVHSTEGGQGRLELVVAGDEAAALLTGALAALGYRVERIELET